MSEEKKKKMSLRNGVDWKLEEDADRLLADGRRNDPVSKTDYLSKEQLALRRSKEVLNGNGVPDASLFSGMYRRCFNPLFGQRSKGEKNSGEE